MTRGDVATLASYVPGVVVREVERRVAAVPRDAPPTSHAERFPGAVLVIDIAGFTSITAAAIRRGPGGVEELSRALNAYLGQIIDLIAERGGDVTKIVGDALLPIWPARDGDVAAAAGRAAACGLAILSELGELEVEGGRAVSVKVGVGAGEIVATHVGGLDDRWLFVTAGEAIAQLPGLHDHLQPGSVVASPAAWSLLSGTFIGQPIGAGHVRLRPIGGSVPPAVDDLVPVGPGLEPGLRSYIPAVLLHRLDAGHEGWLAELRRTTAVFVGIHGLRTDARDAVETLQSITVAAQRSFDRYAGWLKEITIDEKGTTLVGAFGVPPFAHEDDPARAIQAALAIRADVREVGAVGGVPLTTSIGVATGSALTGPVGNSTRRDFAILGQHVNLAARLMQAAGPDEVLVDADTSGAAGSRHSFERLPAHVLKGMPTPTDVYRVAGPGAVTAEQGAMVNRSAEREAGARAIDLLRTGSGGLLMVEGEPGIGKSRLVAEWLGRARAAGIRPFVGPADEIESSTPYHAWRGVFEGLLGLDRVVDLESRRSLVGDRLVRAGLDADLAPLLGPLFALDLPDNDATRVLVGEVRADNTRDVLARLLAEESTASPLLVVLEDVQWLDSASWSLAVHVRREIPSILIVATSRPIDQSRSDPIAAIRDETTTLKLGALSRADAIALACARTGATRIEDQVAAVVDERAEGNPLFIEQLTYAMRDAGRIVVENGTCKPAPELDELSSSIIPDTVQRVITSRLDQLPAAEAMTLRVASVIGHRFALRTLEDIYPFPIDRSAVVTHLEALTRLDLVAPAPLAPEPTYEFRHVITQEVAYNMLVTAQSRELHRNLAEWFERTYAIDLSPFHAFLAHHWQKAGEPARAVDQLELAGAQALRTFANEEAIDFIEQALVLVATAGLSIPPARLARWHLQLGEAYVHMSKYREGRPHLETGLRLMGRPAPAGPRRQALSLVGELVRQLLRRGGLIRGVRRLAPEERDDLVALFRALERLAEASYYGRETLLPLYSVIRILNEAEASGIPDEIARGFAGTGALFGVVPMARIAEWYVDRAIERLADVHDPTAREIVGIVVGFYFVGAARWDDARERFRDVRRIARRLGDRRRLDDAIDNLMELEYLAGSFAPSFALAEELIASASSRNDHRFAAEGLIGKAYAAWQLGRPGEAMAALAEARSLAAVDADLTDELKINLHGVGALIQWDRGDRQQALAAADGALSLTAGQRPTYFGTFLGYSGPAEVYLDVWERGAAGRDVEARAADALGRLKRFAAVFPVGRPRAALLEGRLQWLAGREHDAARSWRTAIDRAVAQAMPYEEALARYEIGRHLRPDDPARADELGRARDLLGPIEAARLQASVAEALEAATASPSRRG